MTDQLYTIDLTRTARRALAEKLPSDVAVGALDFLGGPLASNPHRVGKELDPPFDGVRSARLMREWRILYVIDEKGRRVTVRDISHRRHTYRAP